MTDETNYTDYLPRTPSEDCDENSATLPRRNGRTTSLSSVELSSLFEPQEKRLDMNATNEADVDSGPESEETPKRLVHEKSKLLEEKKRSRTPRRLSNVLSPQPKRKVFSPAMVVSGMDSPIMGTITEEGSDDEEEDLVSYLRCCICCKDLCVRSHTAIYLISDE